MVQADAIEYIGAMARDLALLSREKDFKTLAYLFEMAATEAEQLLPPSRQVARIPRRSKPDDREGVTP